MITGIMFKLHQFRDRDSEQIMMSRLGVTAHRGPESHSGHCMAMPTGPGCRCHGNRLRLFKFKLCTGSRCTGHLKHQGSSST
jgi:hypothetical protein